MACGDLCFRAALGEWMYRTSSSAQRITEWRQLFLQHAGVSPSAWQARNSFCEAQ